MWKILGNPNVLSLKWCFTPFDVATQNLQVYRSYEVKGSEQHFVVLDLDPKVKSKVIKTVFAKRYYMYRLLL